MRKLVMVLAFLMACFSVSAVGQTATTTAVLV